MAAIPVPPPATTSDPSSRSAVALAGSLVAFLTGFSALVAGAVLANPQSHPGVVLAAAVTRVGPAAIVTSPDAVWVTEDAARRSAFRDPIFAHHGAELITMDDHGRPEHDLMRPSADGQWRTEAASRWVGEIHLEIERARSTRAASAHLTTMHLDNDLRLELAAMAAAQHGRPVMK